MTLSQVARAVRLDGEGHEGFFVQDPAFLLRWILEFLSTAHMPGARRDGGWAVLGIWRHFGEALSTAAAATAATAAG